jgi:magnesium chelatase family protein
VPGVAYKDLAAIAAGETSEIVAERVLKARLAQRSRYERMMGGRAAGPIIPANARAPLPLLRTCATPDAAGKRILEAAMSRLALSARAHDRILRVARTIADLEGAELVRSAHVAEAIQYRCLDRTVEVVTAPG